MKFINTENKNEYHLLDEYSKVLAKGYIYESEASKLYKSPRMNYFIEYVTVIEDTIEIGKEVVKGLIEVAKKKRISFEGYDARVYHCCFAENQKVIDFYNTIEGFNEDEGMHVLLNKLVDSQQMVELDKVYNVVDNLLQNKSLVDELIETHSKVFRPGSYSAKDFDELKEKDNFKCISIYKKDKLVANLLLFINEKNIGIIEDLFVLNQERRNGLGKYLVQYANEYFKICGAKFVELEVWSANKKAIKIYNSCGYSFDRISEVSIGMSI